MKIKKKNFHVLKLNSKIEKYQPEFYKIPRCPWNTKYRGAYSKTDSADTVGRLKKLSLKKIDVLCNRFSLKSQINSFLLTDCISLPRIEKMGQLFVLFVFFGNNYYWGWQNLFSFWRFNDGSVIVFQYRNEASFIVLRTVTWCSDFTRKRFQIVSDLERD